MNKIVRKDSLDDGSVLRKHINELKLQRLYLEMFYSEKSSESRIRLCLNVETKTRNGRNQLERNLIKMRRSRLSRARLEFPPEPAELRFDHLLLSAEGRQVEEVKVSRFTTCRTK